MKLGKDEDLEVALFLWFKQKQEEGIPISGLIVQAEAQEMYQQVNEARGGSGSMQEFTALAGLLWRFYQRHSIWQLSLQGENCQQH